MTTQNLTILIVDDEASIRNGLCKAIPWEELNISVLSTAGDGLEALELIRKHNPNIVLTDIKMPGCDGLQLISKVTELKLDTKFIIISGYDDFKYAQIAMRYGVKSYLLKPIKKMELIKEVQVVRDEILSEQQKNNATLKIDHNLRMGNSALREKFLSGLLQNEYKYEDELPQQIAKYNLTLQNKQLQVIVFTYELPDSSNNSGFSKKDTSLFQFGIKNIVEEVLGDIPNATFEYENNYIISIVNTPLFLNNIVTSSIDFCSSCIDAIKVYSQTPIYVGIGDITDSLAFICDSYRIALEALSYRLYGTQQRIFDSSIICNTGTPNISANNMDNSDLIDAIYKGNMEDMLAFVTNFFQSVFYIPVPPPSFIRGMCIYLVIDVQKGLSVYLDDGNDLFTEKPYSVINSLSSFQQIKEWIINLFTDYIHYIRSTCKYKKDPIIEKAKAYINENIFKKLKADEVAAHVNLSESYFTVYFKEKTNENFSNYLLDLKMKHAKDLLKTSDKSIGEISFLLGYDDYRSFNRVFKKVTGQTPSDFRQSYHSTT